MPKGGYHVVTKDDLRTRIKEIEQRIKQLDRREKALGDLQKWLATRKLEVADLGWMMRQMKPKRADKPVKSRKPLQGSTATGYFMVDGKLTAPKGDPEFRRRIIAARKEKGWAATDVAKRLDVSPATITSWEAGRYVPKEEARAKIVKLFSLPADLGAAATAAMASSFGKNGAASAR